MTYRNVVVRGSDSQRLISKQELRAYLAGNPYVYYYLDPQEDRYDSVFGYKYHRFLKQNEPVYVGLSTCKTGTRIFKKGKDSRLLNWWFTTMDRLGLSVVAIIERHDSLASAKQREYELTNQWGLGKEGGRLLNQVHGGGFPPRQSPETLSKATSTRRTSEYRLAASHKHKLFIKKHPKLYQQIQDKATASKRQAEYRTRRSVILNPSLTVITFPSGKTEFVVNVTDFCKLHGLPRGNMVSTLDGKRNHTKGFTGRRINKNDVIKGCWNTIPIPTDILKLYGWVE